MISTLSLVGAVESLGKKSLEQDGGTLVAVEGAPIEGPGHGPFMMALFECPSWGAALFLVASQNLSVKTFFMPARWTIDLAKIQVQKKKEMLREIYRVSSPDST